MNIIWTRRFASPVAAPMIAALLSGCASVSPNFDLPVGENDVPLTKPIVERIQCELLDMVREDGPSPFIYHEVLITNDYEVAMSLSLDVTDNGSLSPTFTLPYGAFGFAAGAKLSSSRDNNLSIPLYFNFRSLLAKYLNGKKDLAVCPEISTTLAGDLGLKKAVAAALATHGRVNKPGVAEKDASDSSGEFSGYVSFAVDKGLAGVGPTWTVTHFTGPGGLAAADEMNTDKLSFGFAKGVNANVPFHADRVSPTPGLAAKRILDRQLVSDLANQVNLLRGALTH